MAKLQMAKPNESPKYTNLSVKEYETLPQEEKDKYLFDDKKGTYQLDQLFWKKQRQHWTGYENPLSDDYVKYTVTGSEAGAIAVTDQVTKDLLSRDIHTFKCKSELWMEKRGMPIPLKPGTSNDNLFEGGHLMEPICAAALERHLNKEFPEHEWEIVMGDRMYQYGAKDENGNLIAPWLIATPDAFVLCDGEVEGIAEFKNIQYFSPNATLVKQKVVPAEYYTQGQHYMIATATKRCFYCIAMGNNFPNDFHVLIENRDDEFCEELFRVEREFVASLEKGIMPPTDGSDGQDVKKLYDLLRRSMGNYKPEEPAVFVDDTSLAEIVEEISFIDQDIEALQEQIALLKEKRDALLVKHILPKAGTSNEVRVPVGTNKCYKVALKDSEVTLTVDPEEIKANEPDVYEDCLEKKFSTALLKKKYPAVYNQYAKQSDTLTDKKKEFVKIRVDTMKSDS